MYNHPLSDASLIACAARDPDAAGLPSAYAHNRLKIWSSSFPPSLHRPGSAHGRVSILLDQSPISPVR